LGPVEFSQPPTGSELRRLVFEAKSLGAGMRFKLLRGAHVLGGDDVVSGGDGATPVIVTLVLLPPASASEVKPIMLPTGDRDRIAVSMLDLRTGTLGDLPFHIFLQHDGSAHFGVRAADLAPMIGTSAHKLSKVASAHAAFQDEECAPATESSNQIGAATAQASWDVVGGGDKGGVLVRTGIELTSRSYSMRLATGARVCEVALVGDRLCYELESGDGPPVGWVSVRLSSGRELLRPSGSDFRAVICVKDLVPALNLAALAWRRASSVLEVAQQLAQSLDDLDMDASDARVQDAVERARTSMDGWWSQG